jgi:hypothetical protein
MSLKSDDIKKMMGEFSVLHQKLQHTKITNIDEIHQNMDHVSELLEKLDEDITIWKNKKKQVSLGITHQFKKIKEVDSTASPIANKITMLKLKMNEPLQEVNNMVKGGFFGSPLSDSIHEMLVIQDEIIHLNDDHATLLERSKEEHEIMGEMRDHLQQLQMQIRLRQEVIDKGELVYEWLENDLKKMEYHEVYGEKYESEY